MSPSLLSMTPFLSLMDLATFHVFAETPDVLPECFVDMAVIGIMSEIPPRLHFGRFCQEVCGVLRFSVLRKQMVSFP